MESVEPTNQLLKNKYDLHKSPEAEFAGKRTLARAGEKVPQDPLVRIQNFLNRFHEITDREDSAKREHGIDAFKRLMHNRYVIKPDEIPENFWENQRRIIRERGQEGDLNGVDFNELKRQVTDTTIKDQEISLDRWVDYLTSPDALYSDALKYFTLRNVLSMTAYDKERKVYPQRSKGTTKPFPDLNREALAYVLGSIDKKYKGQPIFQKPQEDLNPEELEQHQKDQQEFEKLLQGESFPKLYAWAIEKVTPASAEQLANTHGNWVKYDQGSDYMPLAQSLQGHGTGWCTADEATAQAQLQGGDFYVYYSMNKDGKSTIPRVAIRMEGNRIAEVRGIATDQNLDSGAGPIVEEKLKEFPDAQRYQKASGDMRRMTMLDHKIQEGQELTGEELAFLYEIDSPIEGFGYSKDPRIKETQSKRNPNEDMPIVFGCDRSQIANSVKEIKPDTKAYVGKLEPGIFDILKEHGIEQVFTSFPEGKIRRFNIEIGGRNEKQLEQDLQKAGINITDYANDMMRNSDFTTLPQAELLEAVRVHVQDLGFDRGATTDEIYAKAQELGLELCPAEVGPHMRLDYKDQPMDEWLYIGMKQIADRIGYPRVFKLSRYEDGLWLNGIWASPDYRWYPRHEFVFRLRKSAQRAEETQKLGGLRNLLSSLRP